MPKFSYFPVLIWVGLTLVALALGAFGGRIVSGVVDKQREGTRNAQREELRKQILGSMKELKIGDTLADHEFDDLDGRTYRLSSLVRGGAIIAVVSPDCDACVSEVTGLYKLIPNSKLRSRIVFVSAGNVDELSNLRRMSNLTNLFLCDRNSEWLRHFKIHSYPFNIVVSEELVVRDLIPMSLLESEIEKYLSGAVATNQTRVSPQTSSEGR